jgi:hypothetical protein
MTKLEKYGFVYDVDKDGLASRILPDWEDHPYPSIYPIHEFHELVGRNEKFKFYQVLNFLAPSQNRPKLPKHLMLIVGHYCNLPRSDPHDDACFREKREQMMWFRGLQEQRRYYLCWSLFDRVSWNLFSGFSIRNFTEGSLFGLNIAKYTEKAIRFFAVNLARRDIEFRLVFCQVRIYTNDGVLTRAVREYREYIIGNESQLKLALDDQINAFKDCLFLQLKLNRVSAVQLMEQVQTLGRAYDNILLNVWGEKSMMFDLLCYDELV